MKVSMKQHPQDYLKMIYQAGRNCYGVKNAETHAEALDKFAKMLISRGHESVLEHISVSLYCEDMSRSFLAQITRHRLVSYSVKSQHYVKHTNAQYKDLEDWGESAQRNKEIYMKLMQQINATYDLFVEDGMPHYVAREILPNSCLTDIYMTTNVREWRHIIAQRITKNNTPEIREWAEIVLRTLRVGMPELFEDLAVKYLVKYVEVD